MSETIGFRCESGPTYVIPGKTFEVSCPIIAYREAHLVLELQPARTLCERSLSPMEGEVSPRISRSFRFPFLVQSTNKTQIRSVGKLVARLGTLEKTTDLPRAIVVSKEEYFRRLVVRELQELGFDCTPPKGAGAPNIIAEIELIPERFEVICVLDRRYTIETLRSDRSKFEQYKTKYNLSGLWIVCHSLNISDTVLTEVPKMSHCLLVTYNKLQELKFREIGRVIPQMLQDRVMIDQRSPPDLKSTLVCSVIVGV